MRRKKTIEEKILATNFLRFFYYIFAVSFIYMKSNQYVHIICILFFAIINTYSSYSFPLHCSFFIELFYKTVPFISAKNFP